MRITTTKEPFPIHSHFPTADAKHFESQEHQIVFSCGNSHLDSRRELRNKKNAHMQDANSNVSIPPRHFCWWYTDIAT